MPETKGKRFRCHVCVENDLECDGRVLPRYKVDGLPVCKEAATFLFNQRRGRHFEMIVNLGRNAKEVTKKKLGQTLNKIRVEVAAIFSGETDPLGRGSIVKAEDRLADLLAEARFVVAGDLLVESREAAKENLDKLTAAKRSAIENILETAGSYLEHAESNPLGMDIKGRRAYWGAAKQALNLMEGLPETIARRSGVSASQMRDRVISRVLGVSVAEARKLVRELAEAKQAATETTEGETPAEEPNGPVATDLEAEAPVGAGRDGGTTTAFGQQSVEAVVALPDEVRIIMPGKKTPVLKKEQARSQKIFEEHGIPLEFWRLWVPPSIEAQIKAAAAQNGSAIRITEKKPKKERTKTK